MDCEKQTTEYKSLLKIRTGDKGFKDLSVTCVALANAQGGRIFIGYDDKKTENYHLVDEGYLTNLGVLWLGTAKQRSSICYPATVQYIVYDVLERKVRKEEWHDNRLNPKELLLDIEQKAVELTYFVSFHFSYIVLFFSQIPSISLHP